jgi:hypothetical protein
MLREKAGSSFSVKRVNLISRKLKANFAKKNGRNLSSCARFFYFQILRAKIRAEKTSKNIALDNFVMEFCGVYNYI